MRNVTLALCAAVIVGAPLVARLRAADGPYSKAGEIAIGGAARFDYLTADSAAKRLYVTHGTEIVVIDTATNTVVGKIADTPDVHGIAIAGEVRGALYAYVVLLKTSDAERRQLVNTLQRDLTEDPRWSRSS